MDSRNARIRRLCMGSVETLARMDDGAHFLVVGLRVKVCRKKAYTLAQNKFRHSFGLFHIYLDLCSSSSSSSVAVSVAGVGDHDLPLFAISCIHKKPRSASCVSDCIKCILHFIFNLK